MVIALIMFKDGHTEYREFDTFISYAKYIDDRALEIKETTANSIKPCQIKQGRVKVHDASKIR